MKTIANIIWIILGGLWLGLGWAILGVLLCITIIGIPFGTQCFKAAKLTNLAEERQADLTVTDGRITLEVPAKKILTVERL